MHHWLSFDVVAQDGNCNMLGDNRYSVNCVLVSDYDKRADVRVEDRIASVDEKVEWTADDWQRQGLERDGRR